MRLFAFRGMLCRITGAQQCGLDASWPAGFLYTLQPIGGGCEINRVRYAELDPVPENVILFTPQRLPASVQGLSPGAPLRTAPVTTPPGDRGAYSNHGEV